MFVPHPNRITVVTCPLRLTERTSITPGVGATACSMRSATKRETSGAAAPGYVVRMVSTGSSTSGRSDTGILVTETLPRSTTAMTVATVVTGRRTANDARDTVGPGRYFLISSAEITRTGA
jgi:hypothetical protein